jgi:hypothetical protein
MRRPRAEGVDHTRLLAQYAYCLAAGPAWATLICLAR